MKRNPFFYLTVITLLCIGCKKEEDREIFVSKSPMKKNVILEEYTGITCGFCPDGHKIANQLKANYSGRFFPINIHTTSFQGSDPDFILTTPFADELVKQCGTTSAPVATINRHLFEENEILATSRNAWKLNCEKILTEDAYANIAAKSTINRITRELKIEVQIYYTGPPPISSNRLNVAFLQNNIMGQQAGMHTNPAQVEREQYRHMQVFRHFITGQWGEHISDISEGSLITKEYTYVIPQKYGEIECVLDDVEIVVFITETTKEIVTGCRSELFFK